MELPQIITTQSKAKATDKCMRYRWWAYEAPAGEARGWELKRLVLPLATGQWCHVIAQELFEQQLRPEEVIAAAREGYVAQVRAQGLELGLQLDGAVAEEQFLERTIQEQAALIEAFGWAFLRVRLPRLLDEYEVLDVEREEVTLLSGDVALQSRCDAVLKRKADQRVFVYNLKTAKDPHRKQWQDQWLYDQQMMTETLAVERRLGERVYGVVVDGFDKGERVTCWWWNYKELREGFSKAPAEGAEKWQRQRSKLLYCYKSDVVPGSPPLYDWDGTGKGNSKGWGLVPVWLEQFDPSTRGLHIAGTTGCTPMEYWINWLPVEVVESAWATLPPITRLDEHVAARVRQLVTQEREIAVKANEMRAGINRIAYSTDCGSSWKVVQDKLDSHFSQSSGFQCQFCDFRRVCWEELRPEDAPELYQPRRDNHAEVEG